jgi:hypothetical protein
LLLKILHDWRHRFGRISPSEKDGCGPWYVRQRERQPAVDPECSEAGCGGRRHAEAAVIVDIGGPQRDASELSQHVRLFVRQPATAKNPDGIRTMRYPDGAQPFRDAIERLRPAYREERAALTLSHQWRHQPVWSIEQLGCGKSFAAQTALVGREIARGDH